MEKKLLRKKQLGQSLVLGATGLLLLYICYIGLKNIFRYNAFMLEYRHLNTQVEEETQRNLMLKRQLSKMNDADYWEVQAKQKLGLICEGEVVYRLYTTIPKK